MKNALMAGLAVAAMGLSAADADAQLRMNLLTSIDLLATQDPNESSYIGSNPSTVAWDGTDLYLAGWNNGRGNGVDHGIVRISDALGAATFGQSFGLRPTANSRGYLSLDVLNGQVVAAFENGANDPQGLAIYDGATGGLVDSFNTRPTLANWDPGANGGNAVSWSQFFSGRLRVSDGSNLSNLIFDGTNGPVIFNGSTIQRGQDIDIAGNIAVADGAGNVTYYERTGPNSTAGTLIASGNATGNGHNVSILNTSFGDFVMYNDRGQSGTFEDYIFASDTSGMAATIQWDASFAGLTGSNGWFDFDYDAATGTLAVVDFQTRQVFIFEVVPAPSSAAVLGLGGLAMARRRR